MNFIYPAKWTVNDVELLAADSQLNEVQFFDKVPKTVLEAVEKTILTHRPEFSVRFYGFYGESFDARCLRLIPSVTNLTVNCIDKADHAEVLGELAHLKQLCVGIYNLTELSFLDALPPTLEQLSLEGAKAKNLSLRALPRFRGLKTLYLEGHTKEIESIAALKDLENLTLRSVTLPSLEFLAGLSALGSFALKLGGTRNLDALPRLANLKYLEIWQVQKLADLSVLADVVSLQFLFLQSLPNVKRLPSLAKLKNLRRVYLETMKGLKDLAQIAEAPALAELLYVAANQLQPQDFECFLRHPTLKKAAVGFGSVKRNDELATMFQRAGIADFSPTAFEYR